MEERWLPIPNYEEYYEVSNTGKIRSLTRIIIYKNGIEHTHIGKEITLQLNRGYYSVTLYKDGNRKKWFVHRLVAITFLPNPNNLPIVNHKDENPLNNNVDNLEWCTTEYNNNYGTRNNRANQSKEKPIIMCDKETHEPIQTFNSIKEASYFLNNPNAHSNISSVLKNRRKSAYNYFWKYKENKAQN